MIIIAAADSNWGIGKNGQLLARIPMDMKFFKEKTINEIIILGRKTLESFPDGKPLPGRVNIIMTRNPDFVCLGAIVCHSVDEAINVASEYPGRKTFIAGGGSIYKEFLPLCDTAYVTKIHGVFPADTQMENLDNSPHWQLIETSPNYHHKDLEFSFNVYSKKG